MKTDLFARLLRWVVLGAVVSLSLKVRGSAAVMPQPDSKNFIRGEHHLLNDNGAWSWFMDNRALVDRGQLLVGSVRAPGEFDDSDRPGWGDVDLATFDFTSRTTNVVVLHAHFEQD